LASTVSFFGAISINADHTGTATAVERILRPAGSSPPQPPLAAEKEPGFHVHAAALRVRRAFRTVALKSPDRGRRLRKVVIFQ
jgi:hypothetical protein